MTESDTSNENDNLDGSTGQIHERAVSRRQFLKLAAVAGGAVSVGGGLGAVLSSCGGAAATTTTQAVTTSTAAPATMTTMAPASTTTVSAAAEVGRASSLAMSSL